MGRAQIEKGSAVNPSHHTGVCQNHHWVVLGFGPGQNKNNIFMRKKFNETTLSDKRNGQGAEENISYFKFIIHLDGMEIGSQSLCMFSDNLIGSSSMAGIVFTRYGIFQTNKSPLVNPKTIPPMTMKICSLKLVNLRNPLIPLIDYDKLRYPTESILGDDIETLFFLC